MDFMSRTQKGKIDRLKKQLENAELRNDNLSDENKELKLKIQSYEVIISGLKEIEIEYNERLDEIKGLREKYRKVIKDAYEMKMRYSRDMKALLKQFRKEL